MTNHRQRTRTPSLRHHKPTGQAVVRLNGRDHYLGRFDAPESRDRYDEIIATWLANGRRLPDPESVPDPVIVNEILAAYLRVCKSLYAHRRSATKRLSHVKAAMRPIRELFGVIPAVSFGPKALLAVRERMIDHGYARATINEQVQTLKRMFDWAVRDEMVPASVSHALSTVKGLRSGESTARDPRNVLPVADEHVDATLPHLRPPLRAVVEIQRLTGARPGEITIMRTGDLNMDGKLWIYRPAYHKGEHHGLDKEIVIGPKAQAVIRSFLRTNLSEYMFRPDEDAAARQAERFAQRKTPAWPSHLKHQASKRATKPKRTPGDHYTVSSYAHAIKRACKKAGIPEWTPHQLRHSYATKIRRDYGVEAARVMLGHQHVATAEIYAERDRTVATTIAAKLG